MERSVEFYSLLFEMEPSSRVLDRWAKYDLDCGSFGIFYQMFDYKILTAGRATDEMYNKAYIDRLGRHKTVFGNNIIHHFRVEDLNSEFERLSLLNIGLLSEILYVNVSEPYHFFTLTDPDGNIIEISGTYSDAREKAPATREKSSAVSSKQTKPVVSVPAPAVIEDTDETSEDLIDIQPKPGRKEIRANKDESPPADKPAAEKPSVIEEVVKAIPIWEERPVLSVKESVDLPVESRPGSKLKDNVTTPVKERSGLKIEEVIATIREGRPGTKVKESLALAKNEKPDDKPSEEKNSDRGEKTILSLGEVVEEVIDLPSSDAKDNLPDKPMSIDEIRYAVQDENSIRPEESFIDHSILKAAILKEREKQILEKFAEPPIFKPLAPEPEPEPEEEPPIARTSSTKSKKSAAGSESSDSKESEEIKRPIWEEPIKDQWRDE